MYRTVNQMEENSGDVWYEISLTEYRELETQESISTSINNQANVAKKFVMREIFWKYQKRLTEHSSNYKH